MTGGVEHPLLSSLVQRSIAQGQIFYLTVSSDSMAPLLQPGDQVAVEATDPDRLEAGDIVVLDENPGFLTHRYWGRSSEQKLITRGDRILRFDPLWEPDRLVGRVSARRRRGRTLTLNRGPGAWLVTHLGWLAMVEQRMITVSTGRPLPSPATPISQGKQLRQKWRYLPGKLLRHGFQLWRHTITLLCTVASVAARQREEENAG